MTLRWIARVAGVFVAGLLLFSAIPAFAHVHVHADKDVKPGSTDVRLTFHVPNEKASAHTVAVRVRLAAGMFGVSAEKSPGWRAVTELGAQDNVSAVIWTDGSIGGGDGVDFVVHVDKLPIGVRQLSFVVEQTYDDGELVRWSEETTKGTPEPEHPAPVLVLDDSSAETSGGAATTAAILSGAVALPALLVLLVVGRMRARNRQKLPAGRE
jgi:hypothetical protein